METVSHHDFWRIYSNYKYLTSTTYNVHVIENLSYYDARLVHRPDNETFIPQGKKHASLSEADKERYNSLSRAVGLVMTDEVKGKKRRGVAKREEVKDKGDVKDVADVMEGDDDVMEEDEAVKHPAHMSTGRQRYGDTRNMAFYPLDNPTLVQYKE